MKNNTVEEIAEKIYNAFPYDEVGVKPLWQPGGNSNMQERARLLARDIIQHHQDELREVYREILDKQFADYHEATFEDIQLVLVEEIKALAQTRGIDISDKK